MFYPNTQVFVCRTTKFFCQMMFEREQDNKYSSFSSRTTRERRRKKRKRPK